MNVDEFVKLVKGCSPIYCRVKGKSTNNQPYQIVHTTKVQQHVPSQLYIYHQWVSDGKIGGSCWSNETYPITPDPQPRFVCLTTALKHVAPTISFLAYEEILSKLITDSYTEYEYYGNFTEYTYECIDLQTLYNILTEYKLL